MLAAVVAAGAHITPGAGFNELGEAFTPAEGGVIQTEWKDSNDTSVDWTFPSGANNVGIGVEIKAAIGGNTRLTTMYSGSMAGAI